VQFVCDRKFASLSREIMSHAKVPVDIKVILAGKLRRYHNVPLYQQLLDIPTMLLNIRDVFLLLAGMIQSLWLLLRSRPEVIFTKGGFVCLPVGLAAAVLRIPLVVHDSDSHPGLTNRILARYATKIATGAPLDNYDYPKAKTTYVGIPIDESFQPISIKKQRQFKAELGLPDITWPVVVVTGGGLGAARINQAILQIVPELLEAKIAVVHVTGTSQYAKVAAAATEHPAYIVKPFVSDGMYRLIGAADVVVTRAGATALLEVAAMAKPTIIIPNGMLTGGHQLKNAHVYEQADAALVLDEKQLAAQPYQLLTAIELLLHDHKRAEQLGTAMQAFAKPDAALDVAQLIVAAATDNGEGRV
jgi:UDP-N-acetylglucosamine--N-acetylmuramyl-(pentapeptide) pyrophosphoryl-undecaprenol N-acetylglucosamine transferase